jgi:hypothetical protein
MIPSSSRTQKGAALLMLMLVVFVFAITLVAYSRDPEDASMAAREHDTFLAMAAAKKALLAYATLERGSNPRPGELPCPDTNHNGQIDVLGAIDYTGANCTSRIGWFPWKTLETEELKDQAGSHLWYAVADDFFNRSGSVEPIINPLSIGQLQVDDADDIAAIIIAPGAALSGQPRSDDDELSALNQYLEAENADGDDQFTNQTSTLNNDRVMIITAREILHLASKRALLEARSVLEDYYIANTFYPYAEFDHECDGGSTSTVGLLPLQSVVGCPYPILIMPDWFMDNEWYEFIVYIVAPPCAGNTTNNCGGASGNLSLNSQVEKRIILADAGPPLSGTECSGGSPYNQVRPSVTANICDYLETNGNTSLGLSYAEAESSATNNDVFISGPES